MASNMDVDPPATENPIEFHPLAIVHMSDQYTRVTTGGSALPKDAPVVGLLFGTRDNGIRIVDADDIPTDASDVMQQQASLHQAVFPQHVVVGWFRVSKDLQPTQNDLLTTRRLQNHFGSDSPLLFCFMQVLQDKDSLPIALFELESNVLVGVEGWKLETSEPEKIAVETVVREQSQSKDHSAFVTHVSSIQQAVEKMNERLQILVGFLEDTGAGKIPYNHALMRQVQSLVCQLGALLASAPTTPPHAQWMTHLAVSARTIQVVNGYTEKFRLTQEHRMTARDPRRF